MTAPALPERGGDARLPRHTRAFLAALESSGDIDATLVDALRTAARLSGEAEKIPAFSTLALAMERKGAPVFDTIRMAADLGAPVRLGWSRARWSAEHDRLSRLRTFKTLADNDRRFDLARFEARLPARFSGYLIRTRKRLAMEGLRQRHCVASYDRHIDMGLCAIATVFVHKQRWTVQIAAPSTEEESLRIVQIGGRRNAAPSRELVKSVHEILNVPMTPTNAVQEPRRPELSETIRALRAIAEEAATHGVYRIEVEFSGGGDRGQIDGVILRDRDCRPMQDIPNGIPDICEAVTDRIYDWLDIADIDYCNGEGGFGRASIDISSMTIQVDIDQYRRESESAYYVEYDLTTGAEM